MGCLNSKSDNVITVQKKDAVKKAVGGQRPQPVGFDSDSELSVELEPQNTLKTQP